MPTANFWEQQLGSNDPYQNIGTLVGLLLKGGSAPEAAFAERAEREADELQRKQMLYANQMKEAKLRQENLALEMTGRAQRYADEQQLKQDRSAFLGNLPEDPTEVLAQAGAFGPEVLNTVKAILSQQKDQRDVAAAQGEQQEQEAARKALGRVTAAAREQRPVTTDLNQDFALAMESLGDKVPSGVQRYFAEAPDPIGDWLKRLEQIATVKGKELDAIFKQAKRDVQLADDPVAYADMVVDVLGLSDQEAAKLRGKSVVMIDRFVSLRGDEDKRKIADGMARLAIDREERMRERDKWDRDLAMLKYDQAKNHAAQMVELAKGRAATAAENAEWGRKIDLIRVGLEKMRVAISQGNYELAKDAHDSIDFSVTRGVRDGEPFQDVNIRGSVPPPAAAPPVSDSAAAELRAERDAGKSWEQIVNENPGLDRLKDKALQDYVDRK